MQQKQVHFKTLPEQPGVYLFKNAKGSVTYVGKATSLRSRVRSYFGKNLPKARGAKVVKMVAEAASIETIQTDSVLEALILEANLIKKHQPEGNTREKDNKSFNYLIVSKEDFPRVLVVRGRDMFTQWKDSDIKYLFGPFPQGASLKEALKIVRKIFPFRDSCSPGDSKPCFNRQIGLCPGVCQGVVSKTDYRKTIRHIKLLFEARKGELLRSLEKEMKGLAKAQKFEEANILKRQLFALQHIRDTALLGDEYRVSAGDGIGRIEAYDVAHISETARVGVMVVVENGLAQKDQYRKFTLSTSEKGDISGLQEILRRRFAHGEWNLPQLLVIDGGVAQKNVALKVLTEYGLKIPIVNAVKNDKHTIQKLVGNAALIAQSENEIVLANTEAHRFAIAFHRLKRRKSLL